MELIADVGGTNTRCALVDSRGTISRISVFENAGFRTLAEALSDYLQKNSATPAAAAIAVAAPVTGDEVRMTNRNWHFSARTIREQLRLESLEVLNDFSAVALSLPHLAGTDVAPVGGGAPRRDAAMAAIGPGTGLGVSGLVPTRNGNWAVISGEGGHATLAPGTEREAQVVDTVRERYGHCSAERLVSGPGLATLYNTLRQLANYPADNVRPREVSQRALAGDPIAREAVDMFFALLGSVAGNLALTLGALGGVFIAGGIVPALHDLLTNSEFRRRFEDKGRYTDYLRAIPCAVIMHPTPALVGLASLHQREP
ncbi:MAG: glucokinase [Gammaproteobacteria bacterium]|nr:glucokinase [Gammaproteobacteria bacterium]NNF61401.1 glucokinase [Gammaproteobacteria bacterium]